MFDQDAAELTEQFQSPLKLSFDLQAFNSFCYQKCAEREGFVCLLNRFDIQYVRRILFLTHRNTHHFFCTD